MVLAFVHIFERIKQSHTTRWSLSINYVYRFNYIFIYTYISVNFAKRRARTKRVSFFAAIL